jgi:hypothetical protein
MIKEPPYTERYVRWCERTERELIPFLLLDPLRKGRVWDIAVSLSSSDLIFNNNIEQIFL